MKQTNQVRLYRKSGVGTQGDKSETAGIPCTNTGESVGGSFTELRLVNLGIKNNKV